MHRVNRLFLIVICSTLSAGANAAASLDGVNLIPYVRKEQAPLTRQLYWRADLYDFGKQLAIRDGRWKYVEHGNTQFLFDLNVDVGERNNLFYEHTDVVNRLRADLAAWQDSLPRN